jgi:hypothetical protein
MSSSTLHGHHPTIVPLTNGSVTGGGGQLITGIIPGATLGPLNGPNGTAATLYIAVNKPDKAPTPDWTVLNCSLWSASYAAEFTFINGHQKINITDIDLLDPVTALTATGIYLTTCDSHPANCEGTGPIKLSTSQETINYQAIMDVVGRLLVGFVWEIRQPGQTDIVNTAGTSVMSTNLANTYELNPLLGIDSVDQGGVQPPEQELMPLLVTVEQLFQNITLALFSDSYFANATASGIMVTEYNTVNIYVYTWKRLALSYSIAIILTFLAVIAGYVLLFINGAAYTNKFSTIMRTTRGADIDVLIAVQEMTGADPINERLAKARICVGALNRGTVELTDYQESLTLGSMK